MDDESQGGVGTDSRKEEKDGTYSVPASSSVSDYSHSASSY
jgi:hypothetical protein